MGELQSQFSPFLLVFDVSGRWVCHFIKGFSPLSIDESDEDEKVGTRVTTLQDHPTPKKRMSFHFALLYKAVLISGGIMWGTEFSPNLVHLDEIMLKQFLITK
jgi:hypothetical protein